MQSRRIIEDSDTYRYYDMDGNELNDGDIVTTDNGAHLQMLYRTEDGRLGVDATNPAWIMTGRAVPCEMGIYPLEKEDMETIKKVGVRFVNTPDAANAIDNSSHR